MMTENEQAAAEREAMFPITHTEPVMQAGKTTAAFDPRDAVRALRAGTPPAIVKALAALKPTTLEKGFGRSYVQKVAEYADRDPVAMTVEVTRLLIRTDYETFIKQLPPERWGRELAGYLGGSVQVLERDSQGRAVRQIERMVLAAPLKKLDMTKSEVLEYAPGRATVFWRVYHSDNRTTVSDVGYVEFVADGPDAVRVTFQSAHRLYLPNFLVRLTLARTFMGHLRNYRRLTVSRQAKERM